MEICLTELKLKEVLKLEHTITNLYRTYSYADSKIRYNIN